MSDLISREALMEALRKKTDNLRDKWNTAGVINLIYTPPIVDAVVPVRCKDCAFADETRRSECEMHLTKGTLLCRNEDWCGEEPLACQPNDYCSRGERRTDAGY